MKNLKVWLVILPLLTIACSDDTTGEITQTEQLPGNIRETGVGPGNPVNPFDIAGSIHNEILETLEGTDLNPKSIRDIIILVDSVADAHPGLAKLSANPPLSASLAEMRWILDSDDPIGQVLAVSNLGADAKASLQGFVNSMLLLPANDSYENIHRMIVSYEASVVDSTGFTIEEKQIILTATSVVRYTVYDKKKRKDKDWETSVTQIAAVIFGAGRYTALGVKMSLATELFHNNNVAQ